MFGRLYEAIIVSCQQIYNLSWLSFFLSSHLSKRNVDFECCNLYIICSMLRYFFSLNHVLFDSSNGLHDSGVTHWFTYTGVLISP